MAFSASILKDSMSSLAPLPGLYAAWLTLIAFLTLSNILCTIAIARIFLRTERRIIGRRLLHGPWGFLGLGSGRRCPFLISLGYSPVSAAVFRISAICSWIIGGATFINSAGKLSGPVLLLFLNLLAHLSTSAAVKGVVNFVGFISMKGATFSTVKRD